MILKMPDYGQHACFLGKTGSGKSYLAEKMLENAGKYFVVDTQESLDLPGKVLTTPSYLKYYLKVYDQIIYRPRFEFRNKTIWNKVFDELAKSSSKKKPKPRIIYIDEIYHIGYGMTFPIRLAQGITTARQRKLSFWIATQRPKMIPLPVLTEASYIYAFYLSRGDDIEYIASFTSDKREVIDLLRKQKRDYSFVEIDCIDNVVQKFNKI